MEKGGTSVTPVVSVDNITVYQTPYTAPSVTAQSSTDPFTTNTHSETQAIIKEGDTTIIIHNVEAPSSNNRPMWIIPVAAGLGSCVAVIAVLVPVLCYCRQRNRATKTKGKLVNINGTTPQADPEVRYSYPNQPSDVVYYADIRDDLDPDGHQLPKSTAAADFKVSNPNSAISSNLVKNPVYDCSDQIAKVSDPLIAEINDPVYEEAPDNPTQRSLQLNDLVENPLYGGQEHRSAAEQQSLKQPESADSQGLVDNPLYGGQDQGSRVQDFSEQAGSADSDGLVDNPLYGGQSDRSASHASNMPNVLSRLPSPDDVRSNNSDAESSRFSPEQGLSTQPEYAAVDDLIGNPLYGSQNDKPTKDGVTLQNESRADELIDNPLYGAQSNKPDGLASNLQDLAQTEELVDNPLYGDGCDRPGRQGVTSQTGIEPTDELIDNPLYGSQNESSAIGISRQEGSGPSDEMIDNPLYGANS
nr:uncharacterized protein LOC129281082 [Lytechinus pictus]